MRIGCDCPCTAEREHSGSRERVHHHANDCSFWSVEAYGRPTGRSSGARLRGHPVGIRTGERDHLRPEAAEVFNQVGSRVLARGGRIALQAQTCRPRRGLAADQSRHARDGSVPGAPNRWSRQPVNRAGKIPTRGRSAPAGPAAVARAEVALRVDGHDTTPTMMMVERTCPRLLRRSRFPRLTGAAQDREPPSSTVPSGPGRASR